VWDMGVGLAVGVWGWDTGVGV